jgi:hypothetical protein
MDIVIGVVVAMAALTVIAVGFNYIAKKGIAEGDNQPADSGKNGTGGDGKDGNGGGKGGDK